MIAENLASVRGRIADACREVGRDPAEVCVVAVSKRQPDAHLHAASAAGHRDFGENFIQELLRKRALIPTARWHAIGHVQRNKAKGAVEADLIHTVDSVRLGNALAKATSRRVRVLIEVNVAEETSKTGVPPSEVRALATALAAVERIDLSGLMCIPPIGEGRRWFAALRALRDRVRGETGLPLVELSMGMSDDFEDAVREGATIVRIGTAIFGVREDA